MNFIRISPETSYVTDPLAPRFGIKGVRLIESLYANSTRRRHRFCFHQNQGVDLHDIMIMYDRNSYIPPNKHVGKSESLLVLRGELDFYLFNDAGKVYDYRRLSAYDPRCPFYLRVPPNTWHGLRAVGDKPCLIKETISGPYDRASLKWADFAPQESQENDEGFRWYSDIHAVCESEGITQQIEETFEQVSDAVFRSTRQLVTVSLEQLAPIVEASKSVPMRRARLCCHSSSEDRLQEMFIALAAGVDIEESVHIGKDESLTVLAGRGSYEFPNEDGSIRENVNLRTFNDASEENEAFFARINRHVTHKINVPETGLLIHESTSGPFRRSDTAYRIPRVSL